MIRLRITLTFVLVVLTGYVRTDGCPTACLCSPANLWVVCRGHGLTELPQGINSEVEEIDISGNKFTSIPANISELHQLQILNLSQNSISTLDSAALNGLERLKVLDLSRNLFENWADIQNGSLIGATSLSELDLSHNPLRGFPDLEQQPPLRSDTLGILRLINCSIANILGDILAGLPSLAHLDLSKNSITALNAQIKSDGLRSLDLSECGLQRIHPEAFLEMPALESLTLLKNYQLKKWISRSYSLANLDISQCNLESLPSVHLPNLTKINLRGNHIRKLGEYEFSIYPSLQWLDLSNNAIEYIDETAFAPLKFLRTVDLSFNTISKVGSETFSKNTRLVRLNLSRNYLRTLEQYAIKSLEALDVSVCEIQNIARDCLITMPKLYVLNMSRNLLSHIPDNLQGPKVAYLDLSLCHISSLTNQTFSAMTNLVKVSLQGNRLTSGIKSSFFPNRAHVDLGDNAWFCDCHSKDFRELYDWIFLQHNPGSGCCTSLDTLRCQSPENVAGLEWRVACSKEWYLHAVPPNQMWMFSLSFILVMVVVFCLLISVKHAYNQRVMREIENQEQQREEERQRREQETQLRDNTDMPENRNAPDPREQQRPPSYLEAISMPRLDGSVLTLTGSQRSLTTSRRSLNSSHSDAPNRRSKARRLRKKSRSASKVYQNSAPASSNSESELAHAPTHRVIRESNI